MQDPVNVRRLPLSHADVHYELVLRHRRYSHRCRHLQVHRVQGVRFVGGFTCLFQLIKQLSLSQLSRLILRKLYKIELHLQ